MDDWFGNGWMDEGTEGCFVHRGWMDEWMDG